MGRIGGLILAFLLLACAAPATAATVNAASCSITDVRTAINAAAQNDTVQIPSGSCTWTEPLDSLTFGAPYDGTLNNRCITIAGNGVANTHITDGLTTIGDNIRIVMLRWRTSSNSCVMRLTGIHFISQAVHPNNDGMVALEGQSHFLEVDHNKFSLGETSGLIIQGGHWGVVHDNEFVMQGLHGFGSYTFHGDWLGTGDLYGDSSWSSPTTLGTSAAVFYENNTCTRTTGLNWCWDGWYGMRRVERFNGTVAAPITNLEFADHGLESSGRNRSQRQREAYNNVFLYNDGEHGSAIDTRGGVSMVFNNVVTTAGAGVITNGVIDMDNQRSGGSFSPWGQCNGVSPWDQNQLGQAGYACMDQVGRGQGVRVIGDDPNQILQTTGIPGWPQQALDRAYSWGNTVNGANSPAARSQAYSATYIVANRDFYTQGASFNGTTGVGSGPFASRPATCTTGVAYWVTDRGKWRTDNAPGTADGRLDVCTATNTWTVANSASGARNAAYMPYCYPHPIRSGIACANDPTFGGVAQLPPAAPSGLTVR